MRRKKDAWVNATHILKVANFDKPQRTRILEKEVQKGVHEKIQGGYGKYQGTWVPLEIARDLAYQYRVDDVLAPLFNFRESSTTPPPPVKRFSKLKQAGRANSAVARVKANGSQEGLASRVMSMTPGSPVESASKATKLPTFPQDASSTPVKRGRGRPPGKSANALKAAAAAAAAVSATTSLASPAQIAPNTPPAKRQKLNQSPPPSKRFNDSMHISGDSASVSSRSSSPSDSLSDVDMLEHPTPRNTGARTEITDTPKFKTAGSKSQYPDSTVNSYNGNNNILICDNELVAAQYGRKLLDYFMAPEDDEIPDYLIHPPEGFNINHVIDDEGHTAFHWACSMGNLKIIVALLEAGANIHAVNLLGQTPLIRTVMFTNSYDLRSFSKVVDLLRESVFHKDNMQRTVLHHIAESTAPRSKLSSARYYAEIFLAKLSETEPMNVIEMFVNGQDAHGDTALHIAARNEARKCVKVLQSYHASSTIRNKSGNKPQDYIMDYEASRQKHSQQQSQVAATPVAPPYTSYPDHGYLQYNYAGSGENGYPKPNSSPTHAYTHVYSYDPASTPAANGRTDKRGVPMSTPANKPFYDGHLYESGSGRGTSLSNAGGQPVRPQASETGTKVMEKYLPLVSEKLEQLAGIYDSLITDKKNDYEQVRQLCSNVKDDVQSTHVQIREQIELYGDEAAAEAQSQQADALVTQRIAQLRKVVDRSQARDLAELVKQEEAKAGPEYQEEQERKSNATAGPRADSEDRVPATSTDSTTTLKDEDMSGSQQQQQQQQSGSGAGALSGEVSETSEMAGLVMELMDLQRRRREHVTEILDLWSTAGAGEKMYQYRRLVAMACGVKVDEIDNLLGEIEQVLSEGPGDGKGVGAAAAMSVAASVGAASRE